MNHTPDFPEWRPGPDAIRLEELRRLDEQLSRVDPSAHASADGGAAESGPGGYSQTNKPNLAFRARITGQFGSDNRYSFEQVQSDGADESANPPSVQDVVFPGGLTSGNTYTAREVNGNTAVPLGAVVWMQLADDGLHFLFFFPPAIPSGSTPPATTQGAGSPYLQINAADLSLSKLWISTGADGDGNYLWLAFCPCDSIPLTPPPCYAETPCCDDTVPCTVCLTVTGSDPSCDGEFTLEFDPDYGAWVYADDTFRVTLGCGGDSFYLTHPASGDQTFGLSGDCTPSLSISGTGTWDDTTTCAGDVTFTVVEGECGLVTACCPDDRIPRTLTGTVTLKTGDFVCMPDEIELVYDDDNAQWQWDTDGTSCGGEECEFPAPSGEGVLNLFCDEGVWKLWAPCWGIQDDDLGATCEPFSAVFDILYDNGTCTGSFRVTVTE